LLPQFFKSLIFFSFLFSQVHVNTNLFDQYKDVPVLGGNLKPSLQPPWDQEDFLESLSTLEPQTLRWPGAEASNYFDWNKGTLMPCFKWKGASHPWGHYEDYCDSNYVLCDDGSGPRSIQFELMVGEQKSANYVQNHASDYLNVLQTLGATHNEPLIPFFVLNVLSPEYFDPDGVTFDSNCVLIDPEPVNTITQQLDSIAILTSGMNEIFIQLSNEPWHDQTYKDAIWPNASSYFESMISIAESIDQHPGLQHAKVGLFADVHSMDIEDDGCGSGGYNILRCTWNDSMHIVLSNNNAYGLFDAFSIHKYTGLKNMRIPLNLNDDCEPIDNVWENLRTDTLVFNYTDCQMSYLIKWMIITRNQMFDTFAGDDNYSGLYNSILNIDGSAPSKDIWITEYDMGLDGNSAFDKTYSNGWPHALYNLYTTMKYMTKVPNLKALIQNNAVGYSGGYRLIDTYSYVDNEGTNNAKYHGDWLGGEEFRDLVSHSFLGLSPKGETMRLLNQLAWRNNDVAEIHFDTSEVGSTEVRRYNEDIPYYAKDLYGWAFDQGDFLFMNISNDTLSIVLEADNPECCEYDFTIMESDFHARNYQTESGTDLVYDTLDHHQVYLWEFDDESSVPYSLDDYFNATHCFAFLSGQANGQTESIQISPHSVLQVLKSNIVSTNNAIEPEQYSINNIYPNPFNPSTTISFSLPIRNQVELSVYNILGNKIATLENKIFDRGFHHKIWNGKDNNGVNVGSGIYFCKMKSENFQQVKKLTILK
jgi:hypothetical protein